MKHLSLLAALMGLVLFTGDCFAEPGGPRGANNRAGKGQRGGPGRGRGGPERGGPRGGGPLLRAIDVDGDGVLSTNEISNASTALLSLDANGDGLLEAAELRGGPRQGPQGQRRRGRDGEGPGGRERGQMSERIFSRFDANNDGVLTDDEAPDRMAQAFDKIDANGDGAIQPAELQKAMENRAAGGKRAGRDGKRGPGKGPKNLEGVRPRKRAQSDLE